MAQFKSAQLTFSRDGNGVSQMQYTIVYATGDMASATASGPFAQQIIADFFPQAMADLTQGQATNGDAGTGI